MDHDVTLSEEGAPFSDVPPSVRPTDPYPKWPWVVAGFLIAIGIAVAVAWPVNLPYYTQSPGPVYDASDFVHVEGGEPSQSGELFFLTVSLDEANVFEWAAAKLDESVDLTPRENIRPPDVSPEALRRTNLALMEESKRNAIFVALSYLGYEPKLIGTGVIVIETVPGAPADGVLEPNDIIIEMDGKVIAFASDILAELDSLGVGDPASFLVERLTDPDGTSREDVSVDLILGTHPEEPGRPFIGVLLDNNEPIVEFPVDVVIDSQNIGGPSAGMMFALEIIDQLTPGSLTGGNRIAGTGTINRDGVVGLIGGVRQKVFGAMDAGAVAILVPAGNYDDAVEAANGRVEIVSIGTIEDAIAFLETL